MTSEQESREKSPLVLQERDRIIEWELKQERRHEKAAADAMEAELRLSREWEERIIAEEAKARTGAQDRLKSFEEEDLAGLLRAKEEQAVRQAEEISRRAGKNMSETVSLLQRKFLALPF